MMPATLSIISNTFPPEERGKAIGTWAGVSALALAIGPVLGGFLTEQVSWRAIFFLNLPVAAGAVAVTLYAAHDSRDDSVERRVDFAGIAAITVGLGALVLALVQANAWGWGSARIVGLLAAATVSLAAFVVIERNVRVPMIDFDYFRSRSFLGANVVAFAVSFAMLAMFFFTALYMQNILDYSPLEAGVRFLPTTLVLIFMGPFAGRMADRVGPRPLLTLGLLIVAGSLFWQSHMTATTGYGFLLPSFTMMGIGMGLVMSPMSTAAMNAVDATKAGAASGTLSMSRMVGGTFGVAVLGALVQAVAHAKIDKSLPQLSAATRDRLAEGIGGSGQDATQLPAGVVATLHDAFISALGTGLLIGSGVALLAALVAWTLVAGKTELAEVRAHSAAAEPTAEIASAA
jgi:EmrB/QacA subfamily drug resistance transporter